MKKRVTEYCCDICGKVSTNVKEYKQLLLPCRITYSIGSKTYENNKSHWAELDVCEHCENIIYKHFRECIADIAKNMDTDCVTTTIVLEELK